MKTANYSINIHTQVLFDPNFIHYSFINDQEDKLIERLNYHIKSDDYFGTMASIICIVMSEAELDKNHYLILKRIFDDFIYLQNNCKIVKRDK